MYINSVHNQQQRNVIVWERISPTKRDVKVYEAPYFFYVEEKGLNDSDISKFIDRTSKTTSLFGDTVYKVNCFNRFDLDNKVRECRHRRIKTFESDISAESRILSTQYYGKEVPTLNVTYLDIEVDYDARIGFASADNPYAPINSVAYYNTWEQKLKLVAVPPPEWDYELDETLFDLADIKLVNSEYELLSILMQDIRNSDCLCGWNSDFFDFPYIARRLEILHDTLGHFPPKPANMLGFDGAGDTRYKEVEVFGRKQTTLVTNGRILSDYMQLFKKFEMATRPSYKLEAISNEILPNMSKLEYEGSLAELYRTNFNFFMRYNIRDVECMLGFEEKLGYMHLANIMYHEATSAFNNIKGTIRLAENSIINYCHYVLGCVVCDGPGAIDSGFSEQQDDEAEGAYVLEPKVGMHDWIGSIDINSLYPSAIRSINISPERLIGQFIDDIADFEAIMANSNQIISMKIESTGEILSHKACDWKTILLNEKWSVSGFGTVFDQSVQGVIPAILQNWYATRKQYQKLKEEAKEAKQHDKVNYYDKMQYCYKIKLNSLYGALLNPYFRFYDSRLGESTTGTGRAILRFQCAKVNELLTGVYDPIGTSILYGDTDSTYFSTGATDKQNAVIIADDIAEKVNAAYPDFMRQTFLCTTGFDNIIACGREVVASRGIFVTPKRYILKVVNLDGDDCNKLKVMGLDTKKTILPKYVQVALNNFLERLLDGEQWDDIAKDVVALKDKMRNIDVFELGLPKGANKVEKYTTELRKSDKARLPGHIRAAIYYNNKLKEFEDTKSMRIVSGMKVNVFYLRKPDKKFKSIALPVDIEEVPKWFYDHIEIDKSMQLERLIDNPLKNVLKAIGEKPPTHQTIFTKETLVF